MTEFHSPVREAPDIVTELARLQEQVNLLTNRLQGTQHTIPELPRNLKLEPPPEFFGEKDRDSLDSWLFLVRQYNSLIPNITEQQKIGVAATRLRGAAAVWWRMVITDVQNATQPPVFTFEAFETLLTNRFGILHDTMRARLRLDTLKQGTTSVTTHNTRFLELMLRLPRMEEEQKIYFYLKSLSDDIYQEVALRSPPTLEKAMNDADQVDLSMMARQHMERHTRRPERRDHRWENHRRSYDRNRPDRPIPMDLSAVTEQRKCYNCGSASHLIADCPCPSVSPRRNNNTRRVRFPSKEHHNWKRTGPQANAVEEDKFEELMEMSDTELLTFKGFCKQQSIKVLIDSGASQDFLSHGFATAHKARLTPHPRPFSVRLADGTLHRVTQCAEQLPLEIGNYKDKITFNIIPLMNHDAILGKTWLTRHNPTIDWQRNTVTLRQSNKTITLKAQEGRQTPTLSLISKTQAKRALRKGAQAMFLWVKQEPVRKNEESPGELLKAQAQEGHEGTPGGVMKTQAHGGHEGTPGGVMKTQAHGGHEGTPGGVMKAQAHGGHEGTPGGVIKTPAAREGPKEGQADDLTTKQQALLAKYEHVFNEKLTLPPKRSIDHKIPLKPGSVPPCRAPYRLSFAELDELKKQLNELLQAGFIRPSTSSYGAPVLFVKKKDGSLRLCVDYRALNAQTVKNKYPLPHPDDLLGRLAGMLIFSKIDLRGGYNQMRVSPEDVHKTAFRTRWGHFEYLVLCFGLCDAPASFMRLMQDVFAELLDICVIIWLDDILIFSKTLEEHFVHLERVFELLSQHQLFAKRSKCEFFRPSLTFIGHRIERGMLRADPEKVTAIENWPAPTNVTEVRSFLGAAGFCRRYIKNFSTIAAPMTDLLKNDKQNFAFDNQCQEAFQHLKRALVTAPVLKIPDSTSPTTVVTDASGFAIGATLYQQGPTGMQPCCYESRKLNSHEQNYSTQDRELLAIVHALRCWRHLLYGRKFEVITDHRTLRYLLEQTEINRRHARWVEFLADFDFHVAYAPGSSPIMRMSDALSRIRTGDSRDCNNITTVHSDVREEIKQLYTDDATYQKVMKLHQNKDPNIVEAWTIQDGILHFGDKVYVPEGGNLRERLLTEAHCNPTAGHPGIDRTFANLTQRFFWPRLNHDVRQFVLKCRECQRHKAAHTRPNGLLNPLPIPTKKWRDLSMDLITHLPLSHRTKYDAIFVVVDRLTKMVHLMPTRTTCTAKDLASLFFKNVFKLHGLPESIVSDRDPRFTSEFWTNLMALCKTSLKMSTAYHPQTDGQTEKMNQVCEDMLRSMVSLSQTDWDAWLPYVEFAINNSTNASTGATPFYLYCGQHPLTPLSLISNSDSKSHLQPDLNRLLQTARTKLLQAQERQKKNADTKRRPITFAPGEQVMLSRKALGSSLGVPSYHSRKLSSRFLGPFRILKAIGKNQSAYRLEFPPHIKIHDVVHVSFLKKFHPNEDDLSPCPDVIATNQENEGENSPRVLLAPEDISYI